MTVPQVLSAEQLGSRRLETLRLVANGLSSRQVAARLGCSLDAVNGHLRVITAVLGANSRTHAVALAMAGGVLTAADIWQTAESPSERLGVPGVDQNGPEEAREAPSRARTSSACPVPASRL